MAAPLEFLRVHVAGRPLLTARLLAAIAVGLLRGRVADRVAANIGAAAALAALVAYAAVAMWYAADPRYFDPAEPTIPIVGWLFTLGEPIYHDVGAATRYAHMYGPLGFIPHGLVLQALGPGIAASKLLGVLAGLATLGLTWAALTTVATRRQAAVLTGACALVFLAFRNYTFWTRPDPLLLAASAAALVVVVRARGLAAGVGLGLLTGVLTGLKITGPLYAAPLVALLTARDGWRAGLVALGAAAPVAVLPFALPNVSLANYVTWIELSARNGLVFAALRQNVDWAAFLVLPLVVVWLGAGARLRRDRALVFAGAALAGSLLAVCLAASKPGAGPYHLLPFVPLFAYGVATGLAAAVGDVRTRVAAPVILAWVVTATVAAVVQQVSFFATLGETSGRAEVEDVRGFLARQPGLVVQMADSPYDRPTFARPLLTFASGVYLIDPPAVQEHQLSGVPLPAATLAAIRACRVDAWLVPATTEPFTGRNRYPALSLAPLFPAEFREAFHAAYTRAERIDHYDVWRCRAPRR